MSVPASNCMPAAECRPLSRNPITVGVCPRRLQDVTMAGVFCVLPFLFYSFLWWGISHQTLGQDYFVCQPGHQLMFMQSVRDGYFPLWAPGDCGGLPFAYYWFAGQYWPVTWIMLAIKAAFEGLQLEILTVVRLLSLSMSGFFTYLLMRRLKLGVLASLVAGVVFIFNFRMLDSFRYGMALDTVVWLPVMVYLAERIAVGPRVHLAFLYALAQYMLIVPGHTQKALYCILFANAYLIIRVLMLMPAGVLRARLRWLGVRLACFAGGQAVGLALCAVMLMPIFADVLTIRTHRSMGAADYRFEHHMTFKDGLSNLFYPWFANVHSGFYCAQIIWILVAVAGASFIWGRKRMSRHERHMLIFLFAVLTFCILYSLGPLTPAGGLIDAALPFFKLFRAPGRIMVVGAFSLAAISAFGVERILNKEHSWRLAGRIIFAGCAVYLIAGLCLAAAAFTDGVRRSGIEWGQKRLWLSILGEITLYAPARIHGHPGMIPTMAFTIIGTAIVNLALFVLCRRGGISKTAMTMALLAAALVEAGIYHRRGTWLIPGRYYTAHSERFKEADVYHTRIFQPLPFYMYSVKNIARPPSPTGSVQLAGETPQRMRELLCHGGAPAWRIYYQNVPGHQIPRAYVTPSVCLVNGDDLAAIAEMDPYAYSVIDVTDEANINALSDTALVHLSRRNCADTSSADRRTYFANLNRNIKLIEYTFNRASFEVHTQTGGLFNYNDTYARGWQATIDGREVPIYRSNHTFKSVVLPPGSHRVDFSYNPPSFRIGLVVSLVGLCVLAGLGGASFCTVGKRSLLMGVLVAMLTVPGACMIHERIYQMVNKSGVINCDPSAPRQNAPDYKEYLKKVRS